MQPQRLTHNIDRPLKPARSNTNHRLPSGAFAQVLAADACVWTTFPSITAPKFFALAAFALADMPHCGLPPGWRLNLCASAYRPAGKG